MLDRNPGKSMADLYRTPAEDLGLADHVAALRRREEIWRGRTGDRPLPKHRRRAASSLAGAEIGDVVTVNGVRVTLDDGTWGLVRASSNKPELVVVVREPGIGIADAGDVPRDQFPFAALPGNRGL